MILKYRLPLLIVVGFISLLTSCTIFNQKHAAVELIDYRLIWDKAPHNGFTTLESSGDYLYCAFREGSSHNSYDGKIKLIRSKCGLKWETITIIQQFDEDLRDPKLVFNNDSYFLMFVSRVKDKHFSYTYTSLDGLNWKLLSKSNNTWRWNATKHKDGFIYSMAYSGVDKAGTLYRTINGVDWQSFKFNLFPEVESLPNETKLFFTSKSDLIALVRQERRSQNALLGVSKSPYDEWIWKDLGIRIGSPSGILLDNQQILACVRLYEPRIRTSIISIKLKSAHYNEVLTLPSGGDTGYADFVFHNNKLFVSYHSSNNSKKRTSIYLAQIHVNKN